MENYPIIKKVAWRFLRVFLSAFLVTFGTVLAGLDGGQIIQDGIKIGFVAFLKALWAVALYPAILSAIIAGVNALGKAIREYFGDDKYQSKVHKLPL